MFEIKELGNKLFYQIAKTHAFNELFSNEKVKTLKSMGYKDDIHKIIDKMVSGEYQVWSEVLGEI